MTARRSGGISGRILTSTRWRCGHCDIPLRASESIAVAALIQATAAYLYRLHESNQDFRQFARPLLMENKFRAVRYGLDGSLIDFGKEKEVPERELILEYLALIDPVVDELGSRKAIDDIQNILETGTGADRQPGRLRAVGWRSQGRGRLHGRGDGGGAVLASARYGLGGSYLDSL